jgi:hypothetical protein
MKILDEVIIGRIKALAGPSYREIESIIIKADLQIDLSEVVSMVDSLLLSAVERSSTERQGEPRVKYEA